MSKKFNVNNIVNERKNELDYSPLFLQSKKPTPELKDGSPAIQPVEENLDSQPVIKSFITNPTSQQSTQKASKRSFVRRSFDFYEDQIKYLTRESLEDRLAGREGSMNAIVREAIDDWIKKRASRK
jgi:hypothetical protein